MPAPRASLTGPAIRTTLIAGVAAIALAALVLGHNVAGAVTPLAPPERLPPPAVDAPKTSGLQTAVLSGGCFWGLQGVYEHVKGVKQVWAGYAGGAAATANYELVSTGTTGHAETVKVIFDPAEISYGEILRIFFSVATDPTQVGGQYPDEGTQYRSEIWVADASQRDVAQRYIAQLTAAKVFRHPITTRIDPLPGFYKAEAYHQDYLVHHPDQPYIAAYDLPKVEALKTLLPADYRPSPVLALAAG